MKIGIVGTNFISGNRGVGALGISAVKVIEDVSIRNKINVEYIIFIKDLSTDTDVIYNILNKYLNIERNRAQIVLYDVKKVFTLMKISKKLKECEFVMDYTEGDSFTDIYGMKRLILHTIIKSLEIKFNKNLILAPQTYGPFKSKLSKFIGGNIIKKSKLVLSRDEFSLKTIYDTAGNVDAIVTTDVAFSLPYYKSEIENSGKIKIGLNVSALLWNGGYNGKNQFGLKLNYRKFCENLIKLLDKETYEIHLIAHVITQSVTEDDYRVCEELHGKYTETILADRFDDAVEAKSYISNMDILIGARMHATIAAVSSGVPAVPIAYSPKFKGLYDNIGYKHIIDAKEINTDEALKQTIYAINNIEDYKKDVFKVKETVNSKNEILYDELLKLMQ